jgi:5-methylcytosine-specific restriction endonuclease McrA
MTEPLCALCLQCGHVTPATVADHVVSHKGDFTAFKLGELRSLCSACHNALDRANRLRSSRSPVGLDGWPLAVDHPWNRS